jgi:hypothetical protein
MTGEIILGSIDNVIDALGGTHAVARLTGVSPQAVSSWRKRGLPWRMQSPLSQWLYERHGFHLDMSLFGPRG